MLVHDLVAGIHHTECSDTLAWYTIVYNLHSRYKLTSIFSILYVYKHVQFSQVSI